MYLLTSIKLPVRLVDQNLEIFEYYDYHYWYVYKYITDDISPHSIPHILGPVMSAVWSYGLVNSFWDCRARTLENRVNKTDLNVTPQLPPPYHRRTNRWCRLLCVNESLYTLGWPVEQFLYIKGNALFGRKKYMLVI